MAEIKFDSDETAEDYDPSALLTVVLLVLSCFALQCAMLCFWPTHFAAGGLCKLRAMLAHSQRSAHLIWRLALPDCIA